MTLDRATAAPLWPGYNLGLAPGVRIEEDSRCLTFARDRAILSFATMPPACVAALRELAGGGLVPRHIRCGLALERVALTVVLNDLDARGWLSYGVGSPPRLVAWRRHGVEHSEPAEPGVDDDDRCYRLSRFCHIVPQDGRLVAVSPVRGFEVAVCDRGLWWLLERLARPASLRGLTGEADGEEIRSCWSLLRATGLITPADDGHAAEDALRYWEPHDLVFHTESREGFREKPFGGTYRFREDQPQVSPRPSGAGVPLAVPDKQSPGDGHLFDVLDRRRSVRQAGERPCTAAELGEFLYRSARTTASMRTKHGLAHTRPYPSGGAIHELNLHLIVRRVSGLSAGLYRYRSAEHRLDRHDVPIEAAERLLADSAMATLRAEPPDILIVITAELPKLAWKYEAIAYNLVLKHVGALIQTMYLVATAMRLAPCAVGGGDSREFARLTGLDPFAEPAVGELTLGSRPDLRSQVDGQ